MGVKLSKLMMRQYKDGVYRMSRATVAKHVAFLEFRLMDAEQLANERGEKRDILYKENERMRKGIQNILSQLRVPRTETTSLRRALNAILTEKPE